MEMEPGLFGGMPLISLLSMAFSNFFAVALQVALLVVGITVVRKYRPDAATVILASAAIGLIADLIFPGLQMAVNAFLATADSIEMMITIGSVLSIVRSLIYILSFGLLIFGVIKLAKPKPESPAVPGATP